MVASALTSSQAGTTVLIYKKILTTRQDTKVSNIPKSPKV